MTPQPHAKRVFIAISIALQLLAGLYETGIYSQEKCPWYSIQSRQRMKTIYSIASPIPAICMHVHARPMCICLCISIYQLHIPCSYAACAVVPSILDSHLLLGPVQAFESLPVTLFHRAQARHRSALWARVMATLSRVAIKNKGARDVSINNFNLVFWDLSWNYKNIPLF